MNVTRGRVFGIDVAVTNFRGATYFVPEFAQHRPVARRVLRGRYAEPPLHQLVAAYFADVPGSMIHAGTFFGDMLPSFSRKVRGSLYAFEPVLENYLLAWSAVAANGLDNVVLLHAGLGSEVGVSRVVVGRPKGHRGGTSSLDAGKSADEEAESQHVSVLTVDGMQIPDLALLQLDVEGWELPVLQGAVGTIERTRPLIIVEDNNDNCGPFLKELGYERLGSVAKSNTVYRPAGMELTPDVLATVT